MYLRKNIDIKDADIEVDEGTFTGYASVFGGVDSYGDTIVKGAFAETLSRRSPKMFLNHEWESIPIGKWIEVAEDDVGLRVRGELTPGLSASSDVLAALKHGTIDGLSIGGYLRKGDYQETETGRVINKWSELVEVSPVVFPADQSARIDSVKRDRLALEQVLEGGSIADIEQLLRDAAGLSRRAASSLVARICKLRADVRDAREPDVSESVSRLEAIHQRITSFHQH